MWGNRFGRELIAAFGLFVILIAVNAAVSHHNLRQLDDDARWVAHSHEVLEVTENALRSIVDAETGYRGYVLTGRDEFLQPYRAALEGNDPLLNRLAYLTEDNPLQQERIARLKAAVQACLENLQKGVELRLRDFDSAKNHVETGEGKRRTDAVRAIAEEIRSVEKGLLEARRKRNQVAYRVALRANWIGSTLALVAIGGFFALLHYTLKSKERAAALVHEQRETLHITLASIGDAVIATDVSGRVTFINPVAQTLTGWSDDEARGRPLIQVFQIVDETTGETVENPALRAIEQGVIVGLANHTVLITKAGHRLPIDDSAAPIRGRDGTLAGAVLVFRDVSERRRAEDELRKSEHRFRQMADAMPQFVWITGADGGAEYFNHRWYDYTGCAPPECLGDQWVTRLHPDDRDRAKARWADSIRTGEFYEIEYRIRSRMGEYRWFLGRALPARNDRGKVIQWYGACTDIEDQKRTELERLKFVALVENSTDFIAMFDPQGHPFFINRAGLELIGLHDVEQARTLTWQDFVADQDRRLITDTLLPSVRRVGHGEMEVRFRHFHTGDSVWMMAHLFTLKDARGALIGFATVSRDIRQRRMLEDHLRDLAADLSEANRRKDEFLATLAHELRNPLAPIRHGLAILSQAGQEREIANKTLEMMERQLAQMVRLVDDLLDVSRITRNSLELRKESVELTTVIQSAVETCKPLIDSLGHSLEMDLSRAKVLLEADATRLSQVFANLLNNAAKYTQRGGSIRVAATTVNHSVLVSVKDNGAGIPPQMLSRIFEMFTQVDRSLERAEGGLGIGLTLVRRLVEMHGGTIEARSEGNGHGSEFIVRLPVVDAEPPAAPAVSKATMRADVFKDRRFLVVDDNEDSATSLGLLLQLLGAQTRTVHDGQSALELAASFKPEVILLDIGLPKLNGYEVCRRLRTQPTGKDALIVACTGWGQEEDRRRSQEAGFDLHLVKPVDPARLETLLASRRISGS